MYAVIRTGGKQYRVAEGDQLNIEKIDGEPGTSVAFDEVLMVGTDTDSTFGRPLVDGAGVAGVQSVRPAATVGPAGTSQHRDAYGLEHRTGLA